MEFIMRPSDAGVPMHHHQQQPPEDRKKPALEIFDLTDDYDKEEPRNVPLVASLPASTTTAMAGSDHSLALRLQQEFDQQAGGGSSSDPIVPRMDEDFRLALQLQQEESNKKTAIEEEREMYSSDVGQAWKLVELILKLHERLDDDRHLVSIVAVDDMVFIAERFLKTLGEFALEEKPLHFDVGYHYTREENLSRIRTDGLLSKAERDASMIHAHYNGSVYGDGIYAASNPLAFLNTRYGETGLMVVRLMGNCSLNRQAVGYDSVVVRQGTLHEFTVLGTSGQCLPIFKYNGSTLTKNPFCPNCLKLNEYAAEIKELLTQFVTEASFQPSLCDVFASGDDSDADMPVLGPGALDSPPPSVSPVHFPTSQVANLQGLQTNPLVAFPSIQPLNPMPNPMPWLHNPASFYSNTLPSLSYTNVTHVPPNQDSNTPAKKARTVPPTKKAPPADTLVYQAPTSLNDEDFDAIHYPLRRSTYSSLSEECVVCLEVLMQKENGKILRLKGCGHLFHADCIRKCFNNNRHCPTCRLELGAPRGHMPSGSMTLTHLPPTSSFSNEGSISILYVFSSGERQREYHPNPGMMIPATRRVAFLPDSDLGRKLARRLKYAFSRGLTFKMGTSQTTHMDNQIVWTTIPHKTSLTGGGPYGFPDPTYMEACNKELDRLGVPPSEHLLK